MVAGYHLVWTAYGFWLPNDPRGSGSLEVRVERLQPLGDVHLGRKQIQPSSRQLREFFTEAHDVLTHPVLTFSDDDIAFVGVILGREIAAQGYTCYSCIMPDHVHLLIRRHRDKAEDMIEYFQEASRNALIEAKRREPTHPVWTKGPGWKRFINTRRQFENEIQYIEDNPRKISKARQQWPFVKAYDGWMPPFEGWYAL